MIRPQQSAQQSVPKPAAPQSAPKPAGPQLLVSVRDAAEAALAVSAGVDWIDLKNPDAGSLGPATLEVARGVSRELGNFPNRSAAIGELREIPDAAASQLARFFPILKVGLSGLASYPAWQGLLQELSQGLSTNNTHLVPVVYADYAICDAPNPGEVLEMARQLACSYLLVDTYTKDGRRLLDWLSVSELECFSQAAQGAGIEVVVAGSLALNDLPKLLSLPIAAIAVRGAVCTGDRRSGLCRTKLQQWVQRMRVR